MLRIVLLIIVYGENMVSIYPPSGFGSDLFAWPGEGKFDHLKKPVEGEELEDKGLEIELADDIFRARYFQNLSQQDLADKAGTTQPVIARLESGRHTPSLRLLKRIAKALGYFVRISFHSK